MVSVLRVATES